MEKSGAAGGGGGGGGSAPTGCYKCGRPGHWSRDCPSNPTTTTTSNSNINSTTSGASYPKTMPHQPLKSGSSSKPKKVPISRPKLTPDLLLSDDGFGHILRHFPRGFKFRGRGHEVDDLRHLLGMYADWHSRLIPYYPFDQFIHKVEQVCATKRLKVCIRQLREKVANGVDATKLDEPQVQPEISIHEQDTMDLEQPSLSHENSMLHDLDSDKVLDDMLHEVSERATEEPSEAFHSDITADTAAGNKEPSEKTADNVASSASVNQLSEEQRVRMEASRLKALERAAARARS